MVKLYEITEAIRTLQSDPDLPEDAIRDTIESLEGEFEDKAVAVVKVVTNVEGDIDAIDREIKRLQDRKQRMARFIDKFRDYLRTNMDQSGVTKIDHPLFSITLAKPVAQVEIVNEDLLPDDYVETVTVRKPDKRRILADLKAGKTIPGAGMIEGTRRLLIR